MACDYVTSPTDLGSIIVGIGIELELNVSILELELELELIITGCDGIGIERLNGSIPLNSTLNSTINCIYHMLLYAHFSRIG